MGDPNDHTDRSLPPADSRAETGEWQSGEPQPLQTPPFRVGVDHRQRQPGEPESLQAGDDATPKQPTAARPDAGVHPERIGRYRIEKVLGEGAFGTVYRGYDEELKRSVAIKLPHRHLVAKREDIDLYLEEAQVVASLDHPAIVPVHDVGQTEDGLCYIVSKFIEGTNLAVTIRNNRLPHRAAAELVAAIAEALHHAHRHMVVHRDVKPANILIDTAGKPYLTDFGLALKEADFGEGFGGVGTPAYMSPEQARGEAHLVDGRADIFSLGVVFYELLTTTRPFWGANEVETFERIRTLEARPPRQLDDSIPKELERICLKALSKRSTDRYTTAADMAEDLRHFLASPEVGRPVEGAAAVIPTPAGLDSSRPLRIVPKGLRSFDAEDADFFLELLPGPRDRDGLPESIRFWKHRIEETKADSTFRVGLIYGPSGCGKSSLVKAGLLPRLAGHVIFVYVEATAEETEARLLRGLRKQCPGLPGNIGLRDSIAALRRGRGIPPGKKVLIVLDQFEQWLHARPSYENKELVEALRHCDGERVQCIVMVRDDFWMAVTRFLGELEVRLLESHNSAAVDLFDLRHTKRVLRAFGRAFGALPETGAEFTKEQDQFLEQAATGLAEDGKVVCVRLALFAEMMKGRPWTPATLKAVGGTSGVGVTFLEETFSTATAPPEHRLHQKAARFVLKALLPESGTEIRGHMRSYQELLEASGYSSRPNDFDNLIHILDAELRLITPTDPEGREDDSASRTEPGKKYYQLTHDYLVPSLREWLTRKQKETRRGRAELRLAERAATWNAKPENRQLPSLLQWANIRLLTNRKDWTEPQRKMMQKAGGYHALRGLSLAVLLAVLAVSGLTIRSRVIEHNKANFAASLVQRLLDAKIAQVPGIIDEIEGYRTWADPLLEEECEKASEDSSRRLHASLALLPVDPRQRDYLYDRLLDAEPQEVPVIRDALATHKEALADRLWAVVEQPPRGKESQRLRAACALATFDPNNQRWEKAKGEVADDLVKVPAVYLAMWMDSLRPVRVRLLKPLADIFQDTNRGETERSLATDILVDYAADQTETLADLVMDANGKQFAVLYPKFREHAASGTKCLLTELDKQLELVPDADKETLAKRQANAALVLLRMDRPEKAWPLLKHSPDPRVRSYLIHRFGPMGTDAKVIAKRLEEEPDLTIRRALVLSLGEFGEQAFATGERDLLKRKLRDLYRNDPDPGLHAAAEWLLRLWKQEAWLKDVEEEWAKDRKGREQRLERIRQELAKAKSEAKPQWYVNGQGQTMVVIPGPVEFLMGSPPGESGRRDNETLHRRRIGRTFALTAKSVTVEQFLRFRKDHDYQRQYTPSDDCPVHGTDWYMAAEYCNWLSKQEGLERCYEPSQHERYDEGMKPVPDFLKRTGYRLPTEAEWEYACRAEAGTSRYYGDSEELLGKYGWYLKNSGERSWPVGSLKPNDFGLFDMYGNVYTWCQDRYASYVSEQGGKAIEDRGDGVALSEGAFRVLRGAGFAYLPVTLRSAHREWSRPGARAGNIGFRLARTLP